MSRPRDSECPECGSTEIEYDQTYGFYECHTCEYKWGHDEDDPDYQEAEEYPIIMEQVYEADPAYWAKMQEWRSD